MCTGSHLAGGKGLFPLKNWIGKRRGVDIPDKIWIALISNKKFGFWEQVWNTFYNTLVPLFPIGRMNLTLEFLLAI